MARHIPWLVPALCAALVFCAGATAAGADRTSTIPRFGHVFVIVGENQGLDKVTRVHAPYLVGMLRPKAAWLTGYAGVTLAGSLANYVGMTSGQFTPCEANDDLPDHCHQNVDNLFHQLDRRGLSWRVWNESMPHPCDFIDSGVSWWSDIYTVHHDPALYYTDIEGGVYDEGIRPRSECIHDVVSTGTTAPNDTSWLDAALKAGNDGRFNLIVPNDCENGHDPCGRGHDQVRQFDRFLAREIPKIEASPAFGSDGLIVITYDSGISKREPHILFAALGARVRPGTYSGGAFTHYSLLRLLEDGFGLGSYLGHAAQAAPIDQIWR